MVSAPRGNIWSTWPVNLGGYKNKSGTSMASPYVANALTLMKQLHPGLNAQDGRTILTTTGVKVNSYHSGSGLVNIYNAIKARAVISPSVISIN